MTAPGRSWFLLLLVGCGESGLGPSDADHVDVTDVPSDGSPSDAEPDGPQPDVDGATGDGDNPECFVTPYIGKHWGTHLLPETVDRMRLSPLHGGYFIGQFIRGPRASLDCFETGWELLECDEDRAQMRIFSYCGFGDSERILTLERSDLVVDFFNTMFIDGELFEILSDIRPSGIDASCRNYECTSDWLTDVPPAR